MFSKRPRQSPPTSGGGAITCRRRRRGGSSDSDEAPAHRRVRTGVDEAEAARLDVPPLADMRTSGWRKLKDDAADDVSVSQLLRRVVREELCHRLPPVLREELSHCLAPLLREELSHCLPPFLSKLESILDSKLESRQESIDQRFEDFNNKVDQRTHLQPSHCNHQNPLHEANNEGANAEGLVTNEGEAKSTSFRLRFLDEMKPPIYHDDAIKAESNKAIRIGIFNGDQMIKSGALSKVKLEILALEGDFPYGTKDSWTSEEFNKHIACGRDGRGTVLVGECTVDLTNGEACLGTIKFREGSCRARCGKFILAARVWVTARTGEHVQEAVMKPEVVLDRRNKSNGKSHPPKLDDNVHCLEQIANDGIYCKRLNEKGIVTVADLLKALNKDPDNLANILQMKKECKAWDKMVTHARECTLEDKRELKSYRDTQAKVVLYFNFVNIFVGAKFDGNYIASDKLDSYQQDVVAKLKEKAYQLLDDLPFDHTLEGDLPLQNHIDTNASGHHAADQVQGTGQAGQEQLSADGSHIPATDQLNNNDDNRVNIPKDCPSAKSECISSHYVMENNVRHPVSTTSATAAAGPLNPSDHEIPYQAENLRNVGGTVHPNVFNASNPNDVSIDDYQGPNFTDQATTLLPDRQQNFQGPMYSPEGPFYSTMGSMIAGIPDSLNSIQHQVPPVLKSRPHGTALLLAVQQPHAPQEQDLNGHPFSIPNALNSIQHQVPQLLESRPPDTALMLAAHQSSNYVQHQDPQPLESRPLDTSLMPAAQQLHDPHGQELSGLPFSIPEASNSIQHQISQLLESRPPKTALMLTAHQTLASRGQEPSVLPFSIPQTSNYAQQQIPQFLESRPHNTTLMLATQPSHAPQGQEPSSLPFDIPQESNYVQQQVPRLLESGPPDTALMLAAHSSHAPHGQEPSSLPFSILQASNCVQHPVPQLIKNRPPDTALMLATQQPHAPHGPKTSGLPFNIPQESNYAQHQVPQLESRPLGSALMLGTQQAPYCQELSGLPFNISHVSNYAQHQVPQPESRSLGSALMLTTHQSHGPHGQEPSGPPFSIPHVSNYAQHQVPQPESRPLGSALMLTTQQSHGPYGQEPSRPPFSMSQVSNYAQHQVPQPDNRPLGPALMLAMQQSHGPHDQELSRLPFSIP